MISRCWGLSNKCWGALPPGHPSLLTACLSCYPRVFPQGSEDPNTIFSTFINPAGRTFPQPCLRTARSLPRSDNRISPGQSLTRSGGGVARTLPSGGSGRLRGQPQPPGGAQPQGVPCPPRCRLRCSPAPRPLPFQEAITRGRSLGRAGRGAGRARGRAAGARGRAGAERGRPAGGSAAAAASGRGARAAGARCRQSGCCVVTEELPPLD